MSGFPPVDQELYTNNIVINGYLAHMLSKPDDPYSGDLNLATPEHYRQLLQALAKSETRAFRWLSNGNALLSFPVTEFESLRELRDHLSNSHRPQHWYRGQNSQHVAIYEGRIPRGQGRFGGVRLAFDAIIPSYFRSVTIPVPARWEGSAITQDRPPLDYLSNITRAIIESRQDGIREILSSFLRDVWISAMGNAVRRQGGYQIRHPETEARSLPWTNLPQSQLDLISLAQHYEFGSVMVDVTRSIDVAIWFASHKYGDGTLIGAGSNGRGIVYRFDNEAINKVFGARFRHANEGPQSLVPHLGLFGLADISGFASDTAQRPAAQHGGSLLGFENSVLHLLLHDGGVEAFTFPQGSADGSETQLRKDDLCPPGDPALQTFDPKYHEGNRPVTADELDKFLVDCGMDKYDREHIVHLRREGAL